MTTRAHRLGALAAEGIMVLLGVLGAFVLEGLRDDRELAREVRQDLRSIADEVRRNRIGVAVEIRSLGRVIAGGEALIHQMDSARDGSVLVVPDTLLFLGTRWHPTYNASLGAVEALLASGRLSEIADPDLRLRLAGLDEVVADAVEEEEFARAVSVESLASALDYLLVWPSFQDILSDFFGGTGEGASPQARAAELPIPSSGTVEVVNTQRVRNLLLRRVTWQRAAIGEFRRLDRHLGDLLGLLENELR